MGWTKSLPSGAQKALASGRAESVAEAYRAAWIVVAFHAVVTLVHAVAHVELAILPAPPDAVFIGVVIIALPIVSVAFLQRNARFAWVFVLSFAGSFVYGALSHFVLSGPDNALALTASTWTGVFQVTTIALAVLEALGAVIGIALVSRARTPSGPAAPPA